MKLFGLNITRAQEKKESPTWTAILAMLGSRESVSTPADYAKLAQAGYRMCATAFACVKLIAQAASGIRWVVYEKKGDDTLEEAEGHDLEKRLAKPNEFDHSMQFNEQIIAYKLLAGNSYIHKVHPVKSQPPRFLYALRPDRVQIKPGTSKTLVGGYVYTANAVPMPIDAKDVLHLKEFHPLDDFYGLSRLEVAAQSIDLSNLAAEWNKRLLKNDMRPSGGFKLAGPGTVADETFDRLRDEVRQKYLGAENAGVPLLLEGGLEWQQFSINPKDMDWLNAEKFNMRRICAVFGVASELLGDSENKTYSNVEEARKALYMEAVLPQMDCIRDAFNAWLVPLYGDNLYLDYDRDSIEALQEDRGKRYAYLASANWLTVNEKRAATGFEALDEEGDAVLVPLGSTTLVDLVGGKDEEEEEPEPSPFEEPEEEEEESEEDGKMTPVDTKARRITVIDASNVAAQRRHLSSTMPKFMKSTRTLWKEMAAIVTQEEANRALQIKALPQEWVEKWMAQIEQYVNGSVKRMALETMGIVGDRVAHRIGAIPGKQFQFSITRQAVLAWIAAQGAKLIVELQAQQFAAIKAVLAKYGISEAVSPYELAKEIRLRVGLTERESMAVGRFQERLIAQDLAQDVIDKRVQKYADLLHRGRAERIARTELANAYNQGQLEALRQAQEEGWVDGQIKKTWAAGGDRACDDCIGMDGEEVGLDDSFSNGSDGPTAHPNCACSVSYHVVRG